MLNKPKIPPKLGQLLAKGERGEKATILLTDGRKVTCQVEMLTYANKSDSDDSDMMVASIRYDDGSGELLAEEDINKVF